MTDAMRIVVGYDASMFSDAAIEDLRRAGLPDEAEVVVLEVTELWLPPPPSYALVESDFVSTLAEPLKAAREEAKRAADRIAQTFPGWKVEAVARYGSPATEIIREADERKADLVVVGSHGRTGFGRLFLGSVSQKVLANASCSVRVARGRVEEADTPVRIVVGVDGSEGSEEATIAVARRRWPKGSQARLTTAVGPFPLAGDEVDGEMARVRSFQTHAEEHLRLAGLEVSSAIREGDPKELLVNQADLWGADCIFLGAWGTSGFARHLFGSVPTAVAARAHCSVEVVRVRTE